MESKVCSKCHQEKNVDDFYKRKTSKDGLRSCCKECENNVKPIIIRETKVCSKCHIEKSVNDFHKSKQSLDGFRPDCKDCFSDNSKRYYEENKQSINNKSKIYILNHLNKIIEYKKQYYEENKQKIKKKHSTYYQENKKTIKSKVKEYQKNNRDDINKRIRERKKTDLLFKFTKNIRQLISISLQRRGYSKSSHTYEILGISYVECLSYLFENAKLRYPNFKEQDFLKENSYQIHHKAFLQTAKTEQDIIRLNHFSNLELLTIEDHKKIHSSDLLLDD